MACSVPFLLTLIRYGNSSPENKAKLEAWFEAAMESVASGNGGEVVSASANGASFTKAAGQGVMTAAEWATCLDRALQHIENGTSPRTKSIAAVY